MGGSTPAAPRLQLAAGPPRIILLNLFYFNLVGKPAAGGEWEPFAFGCPGTVGQVPPAPAHPKPPGRQKGGRIPSQGFFGGSELTRSTASWQEVRWSQGKCREDKKGAFKQSFCLLG